MTRYYKLVCDYDGSCDWVGADRELELYIERLQIGDYDVTGKVYERSEMPWNSEKVVGSREFRSKNLRFSFGLKFSTEDDARLLESWGLLFPELWSSSRGFDYAKYYDDSAATYLDISERPQIAASADIYFDDDVDYLYLGSQTQKFSSLDVWINRAQVAGTYVWEYSTGDDTWSTLTVTDGGWLASDKAYWTAPGAWVKATMTGLSSDALYYIRCHASVVPSTTPKIIFIKRHHPFLSSSCQARMA